MKYNALFDLNIFDSNPAIAVGIIALAFSLLYYCVIWFFFGKDPKPEPLTSEYSPPKDLSPGSMRYLHNQYFDSKIITALLIDISIKGYVTISEDVDFILRKTEKYLLNPNILSQSEDLFEDEKYLLDKIYKSGISDFYFAVDGYKQTNKILREMKEFYQNKYKNTHFRNNYPFLLPPIIITYLYLILLISSTNATKGFNALFALFAFCIALIILQGIFLRDRWESRYRVSLFENRDKYSLSNIINYTMLIVFIVITLLEIQSFNPFPLLLIMSLIYINLLFARLIKIRTSLGQEVENKTLGLINYLKVVEDQRYKSDINIKLPESFVDYEFYLPYAIALDVDPLWTERMHTEFNRSSDVNNPNLVAMHKYAVENNKITPFGVFMRTDIIELIKKKLKE